jgi:hypothetical protein
MTDKDTLRRALCGDSLILDISKNSGKIFNQVDSFVALSQGNDTVRCVTLSPYDVDSGNYELWDKVGQGVGNLKYLGILNIYFCNSLGEPDWEVLARILPHIQSKMGYESGGVVGNRRDVSFCRAIQGNPVIRCTLQHVCPLKSYIMITLVRSNLRSAVLDHQSGQRSANCRFPEHD